MLNKKGISPLIATVLIIGFTIVVAAIVITFGTNIVKTTTENTEVTSELALACQEILVKTRLTTELGAGSLRIAVDNGASKQLEGFVFRVYNTGETTVDVLDTNNPSSGLATDPPGDYTIASNGIKTFVLDYNEVMVSTPVKVGVKPRITVSGQQKECDEITKSL